MTPVYRLSELDFLRGVAILLVLLRHQLLSEFTTNMGWIGVDLFFTLSGFLVSGLLFKEYIKFGNIQPARFLIRRGFKIYPIYYLFYIPYIVPMIFKGQFNGMGFFSDMIFIQNYVLGWGYAYAASWSLAVEEHFYFGLAILIWVGIRYKMIYFDKPGEKRKFGISFPKLIVSIFILCFILRIISNQILPEEYSKNTTMTHLRIDSLMAGVFISYLYYFQKNRLENFFNRYKIYLFSLSFLFLSWTPFIEPIHSYFVKTIGFTMLYIAFGIILTNFLLNPRINAKLNRLFSAAITNLISKIGFCSYSIYIIHTLINKYSLYFFSQGLKENPYFAFCFTSILSVSTGIFMTHFIENYFLKIRNRLVPNRSI